MAILVPLLLHKDPCSRSSMGLSSTDSRQSYTNQASPASAHRIHYRQQSLPSLNPAMYDSLTPSPSPGLVAVPLNAFEWKRAVREVKRKYLARKYRSCSMQCCEILENLQDTSSIEPLHLIYLHFYAASSFEWCARPLSCSSAYRTKLLRSAQGHYAEAEGLIVATGWDMAERVRSPSPVSTTSISSPGLSASSRTSVSGSSASSPRTSVFSLDDETPAKPARPKGVKPKKKVSFSGMPEFFEFQPEPYVRPDSPTLGWDEYVSASPQDLIAAFPMSPTRANPASIMKLPYEGKISHAPMTTAAAEERSSTPSNHTFDLESFLQTRSLNRFREQLSALRDQVSRHRAAVEGLLSTSDDTPRASTPSIEPDAHGGILYSPTSAILSPLSAGGDEKNLRGRIERLRASGWRRKRFDGRRYEALREQVLGELEPCG
ncbi:hypothetical protein F4801DRAFT_587339 [Xylaria longipes]|nr:hypothetical protein F4801DRAFT_587339 [Xylaria longipes]